MNICFAFPFMFHPNQGGVERVTHLIASELKKRGHSIFYLNYVKNTQLLAFNYPGVIHFIDEKLNNTTKRRHIERWLSENKIDVIINQGGTMGSCIPFCHTGNSGAKSISVLHNDPWINYRTFFNELCTIRDTGTLEQIKRIYRIFAFPYRKFKLRKYIYNLYTALSKGSNRICLLSQKFIPAFREIVPIVNPKIITAIGNPIETQETIFTNKEKIVLYIARMDLGQKKPDRMIKIWKKIAHQMPDWKLIMIGDGRGLKIVKKIAQGVPNVFFESTKQPDEYYRRASILCMTSNYEGWGMVLTEAMSYGVIPIAFSSYASIHDIILDSHQKVKPFSIQEFSNKLIYLMSNPKLRKHLSSTGYKIVNRFSLPNIADKWENLIQEVVHES